jgi:leader peptidase (prepilin peptidase)/N-methyltransferase
MTLLLGFYAFAIGAIVGSFLNVVIHRYPREESIIFPGSHCPQCNAVIRWYDNIPILSFLLLRGRCRACGARIALRYLRSWSWPTPSSISLFFFEPARPSPSLLWRRSSR